MTGPQGFRRACLAALAALALTGPAAFGAQRLTALYADPAQPDISGLKDGSHGGGFISVTRVNGEPLKLEPQE